MFSEVLNGKCKNFVAVHNCFDNYQSIFNKVQYLIKKAKLDFNVF